MSSPHVPRYSIQFYHYMPIVIDGHRHELKSVQLCDEVAIRLQVSTEEIVEALRLWGVYGYPQEYFMVTGTGEKSRGGSYDIGVHIWNYQGGYPGDKKDHPNEMGVISKSRVWGNGHQQIGTCRESFYLGPLA